ncbi:unnamed protein product [Ectocarpus fasciculatus]
MNENPATTTAQAKDNTTPPVYHHRTNDAPSTRSSSSSSTSSWSSSRAAPCSGQGQLAAQPAHSSVSSKSPALHVLNTAQAMAAGTKEGSGPYPLRPRPTHGAVVKQALNVFKSSTSQPGGPGVPVLSASSSSSAHTSVPPAKEPLAPVRCKHRGCSNLARYGPLDSPPRACQLHKRVGQFTTDRHGALFRATREGNAFRKLAAAAVKPPPLCSITKGSSGPSSSSSHPKAAKISATRGQVLKRANRPMLSGGHDGVSQSSRNRTCLFPGCNARPEYGLPGATRAVYCYSHKKGPMVQLFKEPPALPNNAGQAESAAAAVVTRKATAGKLRSRDPAVAAAAAAAAAEPAAASVGTKKTRAPSNTDRNGAKKARRGLQVREEDDDTDSRGKHVSKKRRSKGGNDERDAISSATVTGENLVKTTAKATVSSLPSPAPAAEPSSPHNRLADSSGMAPSVEFLLLRQVREDAKTEAEASGLGRRPRAPSRRALEAAGRLKGTGAQWLSREKRAEDLRFKAELRQQRKQYQAAGLKSGVVLEMFVPAATGTEAAGDGIEERVGEVRGAGAATTPRGGNGNPGWQKVSPEVLSAPSAKRDGTGQRKGTSAGRDRSL